ncbi:MAG: hypothetical protein M1838_003632 [Thelocarpon superellum]|nr:MAG: hypothetical protein M1838_003632 [Thelocarpon superellum]
MASSGGHLLVPMALRFARFATRRTADFLRTKLPASSRTFESKLQPILLRHGPRHPIHPAAYLRQSKGRWYTTHRAVNAVLRRFVSSATHGPKYDRSSFPKSSIGSAVNRLSSRAPFASTLRPNLTGGALPRTAGGYSAGTGRLGGARHFSHTPAAPAEVVNNVSAAVRAFWLSGQKAQFDGTDPSTGASRFRAVSALREQTRRQMQSLPRTAPGSVVDFHVNPTITALSPLSNLSCFATTNTSTRDQESLHTDGLLDLLSVDFARALKDLGMVLADLRKLSTLGDLHLSMPQPSTVRVHFPGCDGDTVETLCDEVGVQRGLVQEDADFDAATGAELALLFPFAPSTSTSVASRDLPSRLPPHRDPVDWQTMMSPSASPNSPAFYSDESDTGDDFADLGEGPRASAVGLASSRRLSSPLRSSKTSHLSYSEMEEADEGEWDGDGGEEESGARYFAAAHTPREYEGLQGIHRFLSQCDAGGGGY